MRFDRIDAPSDAWAWDEVHSSEDGLSVVEFTLAAGIHTLEIAQRMGTRPARLNTVRGLLRELGHAIPVGARHVVPRASALLEDADAPSCPMIRCALATA